MDSPGRPIRAYHRILKIAGAVADLDDSKGINSINIAEAIQYHSLERKVGTRRERVKSRLDPF